MTPGKDDMPARAFDQLLSANIRLSQARTADSLDFKLFGNAKDKDLVHAIQPDDLQLLCLRQDPAAEAVTCGASAERILARLSYQGQVFFLNEPYNVLSGYGHREKNQRIDINKHQAVLYGDPDAAFLRFDPHFMVAYSDRAQRALDRLRAVAREAVEPVRLTRGDLLTIDNRRTAQARSPFTPVSMAAIAGCSAPSPAATCASIPKSRASNRASSNG